TNQQRSSRLAPWFAGVGRTRLRVRWMAVGRNRSDYSDPPPAPGRLRTRPPTAAILSVVFHVEQSRRRWQAIAVTAIRETRLPRIRPPVTQWPQLTLRLI